MKISRETRNHPYRMPRSSIFNETGPGIRVIRKKYLLDADLVHEHDFHELVLVLSGSGLHMTEDGEYPLSRGDLYLVRPGCLHGYRDLDGLEIVNILVPAGTTRHAVRGAARRPGLSGLFRAVAAAGRFVPPPVPARRGGHAGTPKRSSTPCSRSS